MSDENSANGVDVMDALNRSVGEVGMRATAHQIVTAGRLRRRRQRAVGAGVVAGLAAITSVGFIVSHRGVTTTPQARAAASPVHIELAAFTVDSQPDGTVRVTWDKQHYFDRRDALQSALRQAGMPVVMRVGEFCAGPRDDTTLDPSGVGPGVDRVMRGESTADGRVVIVFTPSAVPAGKELFIGYLNASQLAVTQGRPGSVERLVSVDTPLTCTTTPPPPHA